MGNYQVPQFIEDESKLVGPFSFTQLFILVGGGALAFIFYKLMKPFIGIPLAIIVGFIACLISFARINDMPLYKMILPMIKHFVLPKSYQWSNFRKKQVVVNQDNDNKFNLSNQDENKEKDLSKVDALTKILDKGNE